MTERIPQREAAWLLFVGVLPRDDGGLLEIRALPKRPEGRVQQRFYGRDELWRAVADAHAIAEATNVSFGVAARTRRSGGKDAVAQANMLWADADSSAVLERADAMGFPPAIVIASGTPGHAHLYWPLRRPIGASELERANRRLAAHLRADPQATDAARVLRVPGTLNWKTDPPGSVECVRLEIQGRQPSAAEILADVPELENQERASAQVRPLRPTLDSRNDPLRLIPATEYVPALTGRPVGRDGKVQCPFHGDGNERTPSLHAYTNESWFCFGCSEGGSIIDLGARLYGIEPRGSGFHQIRQRLAADLLGEAA